MSDEMDEAGWTNSKMMQAQRSSDAWKDAQKKLSSSLPSKPAPLMKKDPSEFDAIQMTDRSPSGLKLAHEDGSSAGSVVGAPVPPMSDEDRMKAVRELVKNKVKEVVRKKAGGGGYALYAPNKGKKGKAKPVGTFPTKLGAKRAELARFPPKDSQKLQRLRKEVDKLGKDPKKSAEKEKKAHAKKDAKNESSGVLPDGSGFLTATVGEAGTPFAPTSSVSTSAVPGSKIHRDLNGFLGGLKSLPKDGPQRGKYITSHMGDAGFMGALQKHPQGPQLHKQLMGFLNSKSNAGPAGGKVTAIGASESVSRRMDFMERRIISKVISRSLTESLFREEKTESEWDDYISKLSKNALAGDGKFQNLQRNISKKTDAILASAFDSIKKAVGKDVKLKNFGTKHDASSGKTYIAFSASFEDVSAEPICIYIEGGVPKIELSNAAKIALTKADPDKAKLFRAELVTVQERVLDNMDDLSRAIQARDKYLQKMENEVDGYVAGLSPLQISLLKQLLVKKYRKIS